MQPRAPPRGVAVVLGQPDVSTSSTLWSDPGSLFPDVLLVSEKEWLRYLRVV